MGLLSWLDKKVVPWYYRSEWVLVDTAIVHEVVENRGSSVEVKLWRGKEYRHKETGELRRRVTIGLGTETHFDTESAEFEKPQEAKHRGKRRVSYPKEKWLNFETEDDNVVVIE